jgi:hypothetical protein
MRAPESDTFRPPFAEWVMITGRPRSTPVLGGAAEFKSELLGVPASARIVMTGHQPELWHPGILAKDLAAVHLRDELGGETIAAHVVVDHDMTLPLTVAYPERVKGRWKRGVWTISRAGELNELVAPTPDAPEFVRAGLVRIAAAINASRGESLAMRVANAAPAAVGGSKGERIASIRRFAASAIARTALWRTVLARMASEWEVCVRAYNEAAAKHPGADVRALRADELPIWRLTSGGGREPVRARELSGGAGEAERIVPRGLLMTGLLRLAACEVFIHGLGGEKYDVITEEWLRAWLGVELAPTVVATATRYLPLEAELPPSDAAVARAVWRAHKSRHDVSLLGMDELERERRACAAEIAGLGDRAAKFAAYKRMHVLIERARVEGAPKIAAFDAAAGDARARAMDAAVVNDRTWAAGLYPE